MTVNPSEQNNKNEPSQSTFLKDIEWSVVDGELCKIIDFTPFGSITDGKVITSSKSKPYASIMIECKKFPRRTTGFITHKIDFTHLFKAFKEKGEGDEVIIVWTVKHYKNFLYKLLSFMMPKLTVWVCQKGAYELMTNRNHRPELTGEARFLAERPIMEWKPEVIE